MNDTITAFVLALDHDSATIARALRGAGYRVVDPRELDGIDPLTALLDCDIVVYGPGHIRSGKIYEASWAVPNHHVRELVPSWQTA